MSKVDALARLRKSSLVRDDQTDPNGRIYRDTEGNIYHSVTRILSATAPAEQKAALERWLERPTAAEDREMAATRGTLAHNHAEYVLKTGAKLARQTANKRRCWKTSADGLERCPGSITRWGLERAIQGAPRVPWSAAGYARGLRSWIADSVSAIHAVEFSVFASLTPTNAGGSEQSERPIGFAGTCDALLDIQGTGPFIVDWKTSVRERSEEMLTNYIDQLGAYSLGLKRLTSIQATGAYVVVARRTGAPQIRELSELELRGAESRFLERVERYFASLAAEQPKGSE